MSKNILWTGSHGFIAGYAITKLLEQGHCVWGIDNFWKYGETVKEYDNHPNFTFIKGDAKDVSLLKKIMVENEIHLFVAGAAIIGGITLFHDLAYDILAENEKLTCAAFDVCIDVYKNYTFFEKILLISSSMVYENVSHYPSKEEDIMNFPPPSSTYGFQKLAVEYFAKGAWEQYKLPYTIVRPFNCVGVGEEKALGESEVTSGNIQLMLSHVLPDLINKIKSGQNPVHILGSGDQIRCYTNGRDIGKGIRYVIENENAVNEDFNISISTATSVLELAELVWNKLNPGKEFRYVSDDPFEYDVQKRIPDVSKAKELLGFEAEIGLSESIDEVIEYLNEH